MDVCVHYIWATVGDRVETNEAIPHCTRRLPIRWHHGLSCPRWHFCHPPSSVARKNSMLISHDIATNMLTDFTCHSKAQTCNVIFFAHEQPFLELSTTLPHCLYPIKRDGSMDALNMACAVKIPHIRKICSPGASQQDTSTSGSALRSSEPVPGCPTASSRLSQLAIWSDQ